DLAFLRRFGTPWFGEGESLPGEFHGPRRFVAPLNPGLYVTDEYYWDTDRILFFSDMTGSGWRTYGRQGTGQDQFSLFVPLS
ncbi:MAG: hypothetical protein JW820_12240, partial [Spirochaetales bacterium]|nr:hypothetical protein [Spirochaetales bacterium]